MGNLRGSYVFLRKKASHLKKLVPSFFPLRLLYIFCLCMPLINFPKNVEFPLTAGFSHFLARQNCFWLRLKSLVFHPPTFSAVCSWFILLELRATTRVHATPSSELWVLGTYPILYLPLWFDSKVYCIPLLKVHVALFAIGKWFHSTKLRCGIKGRVRGIWQPDWGGGTDR